MIARSYARTQLATAFVTALSHEDAQTRQRAEQRIEQWRRVLRGTACGWLRIGSRTPVREFPPWVTLQVLRGGFATGAAEAAGPLRPYELALASRAELRHSREVIFAHLVGDAGLAELNRMLDSGRFDAEVPEETALLTVAWLLRAGNRLGALTVLTEIAPFAGRLRFAPRPTTDPPGTPRSSAGPPSPRRAPCWLGGGATSASRRCARPCSSGPRSSTTSWTSGSTPVSTDGSGWRSTAPGWTARSCSSTATPGSRRAPSQHQAPAPEGEPGDPPPGHEAGRRAGGRARRRTAEPGSARRHLPAAPTGRSRVCGPCRPSAATGARRRPGHPSRARPTARAAAGGSSVPSAEVLAELVPAVASATVVLAYPDPVLQRLVATAYRAFRRRRSVLLLNLENQLRFEELPWICALEPYRELTPGSLGSAEAATRRLGELALGGFPATLLPNPLVRELDALARYYGIDYAAVHDLEHRVPQGARVRQSSPFATLCSERAGVARAGHSIAANGMIIEQAQILTTHNLATLVVEFGVRPSLGWSRLAEQCWTTAIRRVEEAHASPRPLAAIKNAAYAWRQLVFYLSLVPEDLERSLAAFAVDLDRRAEPVRHALAPVLGGLSNVAGHEQFDADGRTTHGRRLLGWTTGPHWMRRPAARR